MHTGTTYIPTEGDDADEPASSNVISLFPLSSAAEPTSIGEEFAWILDDLAVRMRGNFKYPRLVVWAHAGEEGMSPDLLKEH